MKAYTIVVVFDKIIILIEFIPPTPNQLETQHESGKDVEKNAKGGSANSGSCIFPFPYRHYSFFFILAVSVCAPLSTLAHRYSPEKAAATGGTQYTSTWSERL